MKWKGRRASRNVQDARSRRVTGGGASLGPLINLVGRTFGIKGILAVGTDLFHIFAKAIMGSVIHRKLGNVSVPLALTFLIGAIGGALVGGIINRTLYEINPVLSDAFITTIVGQAHLAGAFDIDALSRELIPEVVVELPTGSNGGVVIDDDGTMTVKWQIRDEAVWSDGTSISGDDFAFTVDYQTATAECWDEDADWAPEPFALNGRI